MKVVLDASAIKALIEQDPEAMAELTKVAVAQVAQEVSKRLTRATVKEAIQDHIIAQVRSRDISGGLTDFAKDLVQTHIEKHAREFINRIEGKNLDIRVRELANEQMIATVQNRLKMVDDILERKVGEAIARKLLQLATAPKES